MAYSGMTRRTRGVCPSTHPVAVPRLALHVHYPTAGGPGVTLSSGSANTAHADFFNAWDQDELQRLVDGCLNARVTTSSACPRPRGRG